MTNVLASTTSFSRLVESTRLKWPAWSAPMVGTRPIVLLSDLHRRDASSIAPGVSMTTLSAVLDLFPDLFDWRGCRSRTVGRILVLGPGELAIADVVGVARRRSRDLLRQVRVAPDELRRLARRQARHLRQQLH